MCHRIPELLKNGRFYGHTLWIHSGTEGTHRSHPRRRPHSAKPLMEPPPKHQVQRHFLYHPTAAEAIYTPEGKKQIQATIQYYMDNARIMKEGLESTGLKVYGGVNAPYLWVKTPNGTSSWKFFDQLLYEANVVGTPGIGFGPSGEGYIRLTAFGERHDCIEAMRRIKQWI